MTALTEVDVLIVGSGPAGISTALHLVQKEPQWANRILVVDKAVHPREKLCGGGITHWGEKVLARLGYALEPNSFAVRELRMVYEDLVCTFRGEPVFRIVRRSEFDHWLVRQAEGRGVVVRQGERVTDVVVNPDHVLVKTEKGEIRAQALVAADGSLSFVRRCLKWQDAPSNLTRMARLIEVDTPEDPAGSPAFKDGVATFDFSYVTGDLQGYYWDFPSYVAGSATMNRGVFDSRVVAHRPKGKLKPVMRTALRAQSRALSDYRVKGHPIRWYHRTTTVSRPRVLLAGDAAGVDPVFGEGISLALGYGDVAADTLSDAFTRDDFNFLDYKDRLYDHWLMRQLRWRIRVARIAYLLNHRLLFRAAWRLTQVAIRIAGWDKKKDPERSEMKRLASSDAD